MSDRFAATLKVFFPSRNCGTYSRTAARMLSMFFSHTAHRLMPTMPTTFMADANIPSMSAAPSCGSITIVLCDRVMRKFP